MWHVTTPAHHVPTTVPALPAIPPYTVPLLPPPVHVAALRHTLMPGQALLLVRPVSTAAPVAPTVKTALLAMAPNFVL